MDEESLSSCERIELYEEDYNHRLEDNKIDDNDNLECQSKLMANNTANQNQALRSSRAKKDRVHQESLRKKLQKIVESKKFHITLLVLILTEWIIIGCELGIDLYLSGKKHHNNNTTTTKSSVIFDVPPSPKTTTELSSLSESAGVDLHLIQEELRIGSLSIETIFMVEVLVKLYVYRKKFFTIKHEMFDAFVIITSFTLSIIFIKNQYLHYTEAIVLLRIWNTLRLIHGLIEVEHEKENIDHLSVYANHPHKFPPNQPKLPSKYPSAQPQPPPLPQPFDEQQQKNNGKVW